MNTFLKSLPVAAATVLMASFGVVHAQSNVTLYGILAEDVVRATNVFSGGVGSSRYLLENSALTASRLGFRGTEDLGGGLAATFNLESGISPDTGTANGGGTFWNRGSTVGMKGSFGAVTIGRQWNVNDDVMGNYFIYGGYAAFRYTEFDWLSDLVNNSIKYVSPTISGFQFEALAGLSEGTPPRTFELAGTYSGGPFKASLTYHLEQNKNTGRNNKLTSAGASYAFDPVKLRFGYSRSAYDAAGYLTASSYDLGVDFQFSAPGSISLDYVARDQKGTSNDSHFFRVLGTYYLSKRTFLNANVVLLSNKGTASEHFFGTGAPGKGQNVFTVGVSHLF